MQKPDIEDLFRDRFDDFAPDLPRDNWPEIKARLDKKKKRRILILFFVGFLIVSGSIIFIVPNGENNNVAEHLQSEPTEPIPGNDITISKQKENSTPKQNSANALGIVEKSQPRHTNALAKGKNYIQSTNAKSFNTEIHVPSPDSNSLTDLPKPSENVINEDFSSILLKPDSSEFQTETTENSDSLPQQSVSTIIPPSIFDSILTPKLSPANPTVNSKKTGKPHTWDFGIGFIPSYSTFKLSMPNDIGKFPGVTQEMVKNNYKLRQDIEKGGFSFAQSMYAGYKFSKNWSLSTGVTLIQTTQIYKFTLLPAIDKLSGPQAYSNGPTAFSTTNSSSYQFESDSVIAGTGVIRHNKYYAREIPLFVNYELAVKKNFGVVGSVGIAYRYLASGNIYLPDVDNIGLVYLSNKDIFPGFKGTFTLHFAAGVRWNISEYLQLQMLPTYQHSLQSNIRFAHWIQQSQRQAGLQFRLNRTITFTK